MLCFNPGICPLPAGTIKQNDNDSRKIAGGSSLALA